MEDTQVRRGIELQEPAETSLRIKQIFHGWLTPLLCPPQGGNCRVWHASKGTGNSGQSVWTIFCVAAFKSLDRLRHAAREHATVSDSSPGAPCRQRGGIVISGGISKYVRRRDAPPRTHSLPRPFYHRYTDLI